MKTCPNCKVSVKGDWISCPLCATSLIENKKEAQTEESSFLRLPLTFNRQQAIKLYLRISLVLVFIYFVAHYIWNFQFFGLEYVLFGLLITWTLFVIFLRKRRNIAKVILYFLIFISLVTIYFDYVSDGWIGWSITFVVPILSVSALLAILISVLVVRLRLEDYLLYLQLVALVGLVPLVFLIMGWVWHPLPSALSVIFSLVMFVTLLIRYRREMLLELQKRMHI